MKNNDMSLLSLWCVALELLVLLGWATGWPSIPDWLAIANALAVGMNFGLWIGRFD